MKADARGVRAAEIVDALVAGSAEVREAAIFDEAGGLLAGSCGGEWVARSEALWRAADRPGPKATQVHVGGVAGEVFALRAQGLEVVVITDRFALASLIFCDARAAIRAVLSEGPHPWDRAAEPGPPDREYAG